MRRVQMFINDGVDEAFLSFHVDDSGKVRIRKATTEGLDREVVNEVARAAAKLLPVLPDPDDVNLG